jgi:hypothetical protein
VCEDAPGELKRLMVGDFFFGFMRERRSLPISSEVALKNEKDGTGKLVVNSVICGVVDELSSGRTGRRGSWVRHAVMGVLRWKDLTGVRTSTPTDQKEVRKPIKYYCV